jgi:hypothetical protein
MLLPEHSLYSSMIPALLINNTVVFPFANRPAVFIHKDDVIGFGAQWQSSRVHNGTKSGTGTSAFHNTKEPNNGIVSLMPANPKGRGQRNKIAAP